MQETEKIQQNRFWESKYWKVTHVASGLGLFYWSASLHSLLFSKKDDYECFLAIYW